MKEEDDDEEEEKKEDEVPPCVFWDGGRKEFSATHSWDVLVSE